MENFEALKPVAFLRANVCLRISNTIVGKDKKVLLAQKSNRVDWAYQVRIYKLIKLLRSFLQLLIIDLGGLGSLAVIADMTF